MAGGAIAEEAISRLHAAGLDRETAIFAQRTIVRFVLGASLIDQAGDDAPAPVGADELAALAAERPLVGELMRSMGPATDEALFEFGLELLLTGLAARISSGTPGTSSRDGSPG